MKWSDRAIILSARRLGENSAIIHLLTPEHGMYAGVDRSAFSKSKRGLYQIGNIVMAEWKARLAEHMGMVSCEMVHPVAAEMIHDPDKLAVLSAACVMVEKVLLEREKQFEIFESFEWLIHSLCHDKDYLADYVKLEFALLSCSGFGVDLERCAATGQTHDLTYVSPKSGRAVSREAGLPYHDKMLLLPDFLFIGSGQAGRVAKEEIMNGMRLCGYFLKERVFSHRNIPMPQARGRLVNMLHREELCPVP